jgi:hypothetical protein
VPKRRMLEMADTRTDGFVAGFGLESAKTEFMKTYQTTPVHKLSPQSLLEGLRQIERRCHDRYKRYVE